jgi:hypothetical protein
MCVLSTAALLKQQNGSLELVSLIRKKICRFKRLKREGLMQGLQ